MKITIIDGQGGKIGSNLIEQILKKTNNRDNFEILAVGTNSNASAAMIKAGADVCATGENPVIVACRDSDIIAGPVGIVIADSLYGEVTEKMAVAVSKSNALRVLIPFNKCNSFICCPNISISESIEIAARKICDCINELSPRNK